MPKCLICSNDTEKKICDNCTNSSISPEGLAQINSEIINQTLREQLFLLDSEIKNDPENGILYYWKGVFQEFAGNVEEAIRSFDRATRFEQNMEAAWTKKGNILFELGRYREAIRSLQQASELRPDDQQVHKVLGYCMQEEGMHDKAIEVYTRILTVKPDDTETLNAIGACYGEEEEWDKAIEVYNKALAINEGNPQTLSGLAKAYNMINKFEEAIEVYMSAISKGAKDPDLWVGLGDAYLHVQEFNNAIESYEKAISIQPNLRLRTQGKDLVGSMKETLHLGGFGTVSEQLAGTEAQRLLNQALKSFNEGNYKFALQSLKDVSKLSEDAKRFYESTIEYIRNDVKVLDRHGIEHVEIDKLLNDATDAFSKSSMTEAYALAKIAQGKTNEMIQPLIKGEAEETLGVATQLYSALKSKDIGVGEAEDLLLKAQDAFSNQEFLETRSFGNKAQAILQGIYREYQRDLSSQKISEIEERLASAQEEGIKVEDLKKTLSEAKATHETRDYTASLQKCTAIEGELANLRKEKLIEFIRTTIGTAKEIVMRVQERGIDVEAGNGLIEQASHAFSEGDFESANEIAQKLEEYAADKHHGLKRILAKEALEGLKQILDIGREEGLELSDSNLLYQEATEAFDIEKFDISIELAQKDLEITKPMVNEALESKAKKMFNEVAQLISECKDYEIDVQQQIEIMSKSQEFYAAKDYLPSIQISQQVMQMLDEIRLEHLKRISLDVINESNETITALEARYPGIDLGESKGLLTEATDYYNNEKFQEAWGWSKNAKEQLDDAVAVFLKEKSEKNIEEIEAMALEVDELFATSRETDKDLTPFYDRFNGFKGQVDHLKGLQQASEHEQSYQASTEALHGLTLLREEIYKDFCVFVLTELRDTLSEHKELGLDITEGTERFKVIQEPFKNSEFQSVIGMSRECKDWLFEIKAAFLKEHTQELAEKATASLQEAKGLECEVEDLDERHKTGIEMERAENYENAIMIFNEVNTEALKRSNVKLQGDAQKAIKETQEQMVKLQELGVDITEPGQMMNEAVNLMNSQDFRGCLHQANSVQERCNELENEYYRLKAEEAFQNVGTRMEKLEQRELDVTRAREELDKGHALFEEGKFIEANETAASALRLCDVITYQTLLAMGNEQAETMKTEFEEAKGQGMEEPELTEQFAQQSAALQELALKPEEELNLPDDLQSPKGIREELVKIQKELQAKKLALLTQKANDLYATAGEKRGQLEGFGIDLSPTDDSFVAGQDALGAQDPATAIQQLEWTITTCDELLNDYYQDKAIEEHNALDAQVKEAEDEGVLLESIQPKLQDVKDVLEKEEYAAAINEIAVAKGMLEELIQEHWKAKAMEMLTKGKEAILALKNEGIDFTRANEVFTSAKPAFGENDFKTVISICEKTVTVCEEIRFEHRKNNALASVNSINETREGAKPIIEELVEQFSQDVAELNKQFENLLARANEHIEKEEFEDVTPLVEEAQAANKTLYDQLMNKRIEKTAQDTIARMDEALKPLVEEGIDVASAQSHLNQTQDIMAKEEFEVVISREEEFNQILESARIFYLKQKAEQVQKDVQENIKALTVLGQDATDFQNNYATIDQTLQQGQYEEAFNGLQELNRKLLDTRSSFYHSKSSEVLKSYSHVLELAIGDDMDASEFSDYYNPLAEELQVLDPVDLAATEAFYKKILEQVEPKLDDLKFAHAAYLKEKAKATAEGSLNKMEEARQILENDGVDTEGVMDYLNETKTLFNAEKYDEVLPREPEFQKMLEGARIFHLKKQAQKELELTKNKVREVAQLGIDITYFQEQFTKAKPMFEQAQYVEVCELMGTLRSEADSAAAKHYIDILSGEFGTLDQGLSEAGQTGMDVSIFQERADELKTAYQALDQADVEGITLFHTEKLESLKGLIIEVGTAKEEHLKKLAREKAESVLTSMEGKLSQCDQRWNLEKAKTFLDETKGLLGEEKFDEIPSKEEVFDKLLDVAEKKYIKDQLVERFKSIKTDLKSAKETGMDITELAQQLVGAKDKLVNNEYDATGDFLNQLEKDIIVSKGTFLLNTAKHAVEQFLGRVEQANASGVEVSLLLIEAGNLQKQGEPLSPQDMTAIESHSQNVNETIPELDADLQAEIAEHQKEQAEEPGAPADPGRISGFQEQRSALESEIGQVKQQREGLERELEALIQRKKEMEASEGVGA